MAAFPVGTMVVRDLAITHALADVADVENRNNEEKIFHHIVKILVKRWRGSIQIPPTD